MTDRVLVVCTAAMIETAGMMAENQARAQRGQALAYDDSAFFEAAERVRAELMGELGNAEWPLPVSRRMPV